MGLPTPTLLRPDPRGRRLGVVHGVAAEESRLLDLAPEAVVEAVPDDPAPLCPCGTLELPPEDGAEERGRSGHVGYPEGDVTHVTLLQARLNVAFGLPGSEETIHRWPNGSRITPFRPYS